MQETLLEPPRGGRRRGPRRPPCASPPTSAATAERPTRDHRAKVADLQGFCDSSVTLRAPSSGRLRLVSLCQLLFLPRSAGSGRSRPVRPAGLSVRGCRRGGRDHSGTTKGLEWQRSRARAPTSYGAKDITVLEGLEAVRKRPGMYIGSTGIRGLHHLVYEVLDNSVDEALAGHATEVTVTIHPDNSVTVVDDGRGIPTDIMEKEGKPAAEVVLTVLHAGGKFGDGGGYKVSGGLHGVGVSVVNALSERLHLKIGYARRGARAGLRARRPAGTARRHGQGRRTTGTTITFMPDAEIFEELNYDFETLASRMRETAFLTRGLRITLIDERGEGQERGVPLRGRHRRLRRPPERDQGPAAREDRLLRERRRRGRGRDRDAVEHRLPGVGVHLRQQHQHARGRLAPLRLPLGADPDPERLRAREGPAQGEGPEPERRRQRARA